MLSKKKYDFCHNKKIKMADPNYDSLQGTWVNWYVVDRKLQVTLQYKMLLYIFLKIIHLVLFDYLQIIIKWRIYTLICIFIIV